MPKRTSAKPSYQPAAKRSKYGKELLEEQLEELSQENEEIRAAADRNAAKLCQVARLNREYLNTIDSLRAAVTSMKKVESRACQTELQNQLTNKQLHQLQSELAKEKNMRRKIAAENHQLKGNLNQAYQHNANNKTLMATLTKRFAETNKEKQELAAAYEKVKQKATKSATEKRQHEECQKHFTTMHDGIKHRSGARTETRKVKHLEEKVQSLERDLEVSKQKADRLRNHTQKSAVTKKDKHGVKSEEASQKSLSSLFKQLVRKQK